jgi:hypothetical protein
VACATEIVAALVGLPSDGLHPDVVDWVGSHRTLDVVSLVPEAIHSLPLVFADDSELNELWLPTGDDYAKWKNGLLDLLSRLEGLSRRV